MNNSSGWSGFSGWSGWQGKERRECYAFWFLPSIKLQKFGPQSFYIEIAWFFWNKNIYINRRRKHGPRG